MKVPKKKELVPGVPRPGKSELGGMDQGKTPLLFFLLLQTSYQTSVAVPGLELM